MSTPTFQIIDLTGKVIAPLANGGTIPVGLPPYTIECLISGVNVTKFSVDGGPQITQQSVPRVVNGKPPLHALNLSTGSHVVAIEADGATLAPLKFVVQAATLGSNLADFASSANDPIAHPQLLTALKAGGGSTVRLWTTGTIGDLVPASAWTTVENWNKVGISPILDFNFQNSKKRCMAPATADIETTLSSYPAGLKYSIEAGNELDTSWNGQGQMPGDVYWNDTAANYKTTLQTIWNVMHPRGIPVICGSVLRSLNFYQSLKALGAFSYCDSVGVHAYSGTAAANLVWLDQGIAFAASIGKSFVATELNIRGTAANAQAQIPLLKKGLLARNGTFCFFPLMNIPADTLDPFAPLTTSYANSGYYGLYL